VEEIAGRREAVVAVLQRDDRILVILRGPQARQPGYWAPLSGTVEPGERQEDTLVREVREEIGLEVAPVGKVWESTTADGSFVLHWWTAAVTGGAIVLAPNEVSEARWVAPAEFTRLQPTFAGDRHFFAEVLPGL
jgi:8-oxo-dGTP pyrophosphatase MutT (NUDIX family)